MLILMLMLTWGGQSRLCSKALVPVRRANAKPFPATSSQRFLWPNHYPALDTIHPATLPLSKERLLAIDQQHTTSSILQKTPISVTIQLPPIPAYHRPLAVGPAAQLCCLFARLSHQALHRVLLTPNLVSLLDIAANG